MSKVAINQSSLKKSSSFFYAISGEYHAIALMAIAAYLVAYVSFPATPGIWNVDFMGWLGWADQLHIKGCPMRCTCGCAIGTTPYGC